MKKNKRTTNKAWFEGHTVQNEAYFKELVSALAPKYQKEMMKKLNNLTDTNPQFEVEFSNPTVALVARRIIEAFCQEWYHIVPFVFLSEDMKTVRVDWRKPL